MKNKATKHKLIAFAIILLTTTLSTNGFSQTLKEKMLAKKQSLAAKMKKDNSEMYQCGYKYEMSMGTKLNPMRALQKGLGNSMTQSHNSDLGKTAISIFYQAHLHPEGLMRFVTKTDGWETCGDAVFAGFTNRSGVGLSSTDGDFYVNDKLLEPAGIGTFFYGFAPEERGEKTVKITSSNGNSLQVTVAPAEPLEIITVDGKSKTEDLVIDGSKDIVIQLKNGDADPKSDLHVQLVANLMGTPVIYDVIVTKAKNSLTIPKEAFKNFEGSPSPFAKENALIVNRVNQKIINNTDAGAIRTLSAYMDWRPVTVSGDIAKGSIMTAGFDSTKTTSIDIDLVTDGEYNIAINKSSPYYAPPVKLIHKVAFASFVIRGNLSAEDVTTGNGWKTIWTKWFPELKDDTWNSLANNMYSEIEKRLESQFGWDIIPLSKVVNSNAYSYIKPITDSVSKNFVEVGAGNTQRILTSSSVDMWKDLSITFGGDFVSQRLVKELDVDAVLAITVDLNFDFDSEGLDPVISIVAFAPDVSYKTSAKYFSMSANTKAKSLSESKELSGTEYQVLYQMIKTDAFYDEFIEALKKLSAMEDKYPVYEKLWTEKLK